MKNRNKMNNNGFSLVELIIVIAIMAVLIGVLAPQYMKYVEKGRVSTDKDNVIAIEDAIKVYYVDPDSTESFSGTTTVKISRTAITVTGSTTAVDAAVKNAGLATNAAALPKLTNKNTFDDTTITITIDSDGNISTTNDLP